MVTNLRKWLTAVSIAGIALVGVAAPAGAQQGPYLEPRVEERDLSRTGGAGDPGDPASKADPGDPGDPGLPVTGSDLLGLAAIGAGAVAVGSALHLRRRRPEAKPTS